MAGMGNVTSSHACNSLNMDFYATANEYNSSYAIILSPVVNFDAIMSLYYDSTTNSSTTTTTSSTTTPTTNSTSPPSSVAGFSLPIVVGGSVFVIIAIVELYTKRKLDNVY